jgi:excisionase family DNA binding protein
MTWPPSSPGTTRQGSDMATPETGRAEQRTSAIARLLASDMREKLLAIIREISGRNPSAERLAYSPDEAAELLGISRELVHDLLRTGQLGSVKAERRRLISSRGRSREDPGRPRTWPAPTSRPPRGTAGSRKWASVQKACPRSDHRETSTTSTATRATGNIRGDP